MEILDHKPGRVLWRNIDPEGRARFEWRATTEQGTPIEPSFCFYSSRRQAELAWKRDNPRPAGRPRSASDRNRRAGGNPVLTVRLPEPILTQVQARGGPEWVRGLIQRELAP